MPVTSGAGVRIEGMARLDRTMVAAGRSLAGAPMGAAARKTGPVLLGNVKAATPRRTGRLAASIRLVPAGDPLSVAVSASAGHAPAIEFGVGARPGLRGGHNVRARRMLSRGLAATRPAATGAAAAVVQATMRTVKGD